MEEVHSLYIRTVLAPSTTRNGCQGLRIRLRVCRLLLKASETTQVQNSDSESSVNFGNGQVAFSGLNTRVCRPSTVLLMNAREPANQRALFDDRSLFGHLQQTRKTLEKLNFRSLRSSRSACSTCSNSIVCMATTKLGLSFRFNTIPKRTLN